MPNYCENSVTFMHSDPEMITKLVEGFNKEQLFGTFFPCPEDLVNTIAGSYGDTAEQAELERKEQENINKYGYKNWYDWKIAQWGTKWDTGGSDDGVMQEVHIGMQNSTVDEQDSQQPMKQLTKCFEITLSFETAWSPPCDWYAKMVDLGFIITAYFWEPGCGFCGKFEGGTEAGIIDETFNIEGNSSWVKENIPEEIDEAFGISSHMDEWEQDEAENNEEEGNEEEENSIKLLTSSDPSGTIPG